MKTTLYTHAGRQFGKSRAMTMSMMIRFGYFSMESGRKMDERAATFWRRLWG